MGKPVRVVSVIGTDDGITESLVAEARHTRDVSNHHFTVEGLVTHVPDLDVREDFGRRLLWTGQDFRWRL